MKRRGFIKALVAGLGAVALAEELDVDRLLWEPGRKAFSIPEIVTPKNVAPGGNTLVTADWVTREALGHLENQLTATGMFRDGRSIRFVRGFEIDQVFVHRFDVIYGYKTVRPEFAVRIATD